MTIHLHGIDAARALQELRALIEYEDLDVTLTVDLTAAQVTEQAEIDAESEGT